MSFVSIISSPFQLVGLNEYLFQNQIKNYKLIVLVYNKKEKEQVINVSDFLSLKIENLVIGKRGLQYLWIKKIFSDLSFAQELIIGNFFSDTHLYASNILRHEKLIVLDDGINSTLISNFIGTNKRVLKNNLIRQLFFYFFSINVDYPKKIILFTFFKNLKKNKLIEIKRNLFNDLKKQILDFEITDETLFIGQPLIEIKLMDRKQYFKYLKKIKRLFPNFKYVPSRKENTSNLKYIRDTLNIDILKTNINIELYFLINKRLPQNIFGFTSTALLILNHIYNSQENLINIKSIKAKFKNRRLSKEIVDIYYERIKYSGIEIIDYDKF